MLGVHILCCHFHKCFDLPQDIHKKGKVIASTCHNNSVTAKSVSKFHKLSASHITVQAVGSIAIFRALKAQRTKFVTAPASKCMKTRILYPFISILHHSARIIV